MLSCNPFFHHFVVWMSLYISLDNEKVIEGKLSFDDAKMDKAIMTKSFCGHKTMSQFCGIYSPIIQTFLQRRQDVNLLVTSFQDIHDVLIFRG